MIRILPSRSVYATTRTRSVADRPRLRNRASPSECAGSGIEVNNRHDAATYLVLDLLVVSKQIGSRYAFEIVTIFGFSSLSAWKSGSVARHRSLIDPS